MIFFFFFFLGGGGGYEDCVDIFGGGGHHKIGLYLEILSMLFSLFLRSRYRMGEFLGVAKISNIFWGAWNF